MAKILVVTPVKDSLENTIQTAEAIKASNIEVDHIIYNDFSTKPTTEALIDGKERIGYSLINLEDITNTPSPNYKLVLQMAQKKALENNVPMIIVESDVEVRRDTFERLVSFYQTQTNSGLIGAITVGHDGKVNFPYLKFKDNIEKHVATSRSLSFCCTLFSTDFLKAYDFQDLDSSKDWYDTTISQKALALGFRNFVLMDVPVLHKPHGSRPWKMLKYSNPLKYYWKKFWGRKDKI